MLQVVICLIKHHITQATTEHYANDTPEQHIVNIFDAPALRLNMWSPQLPARQYNKQNKSQQIHQAVPAYG